MIPGRKPRLGGQVAPRASPREFQLQLFQFNSVSFHGPARLGGRVEPRASPSRLLHAAISAASLRLAHLPRGCFMERFLLPACASRISLAAASWSDFRCQLAPRASPTRLLHAVISTASLNLAHLPHSAASCSDFRCHPLPACTSRISLHLTRISLREVEGDARGSGWFKSARSLVQRFPLLFPFPFAAPSASEHAARAGRLGSVQERPSMHRRRSQRSRPGPRPPSRVTDRGTCSETRKRDHEPGFSVTIPNPFSHGCDLEACEGFPSHHRAGDSERCLSQNRQ